MSRSLLALCAVVVAAALWVLWPAGAPPEPVDLGGSPVAGTEADAAASIVELDPSTEGRRVPAAPVASGGAGALEDEVPPDEPPIEPDVALLPLSFLDREGASYSSGVIVVSRVPREGETRKAESSARLPYEELDWSPADDVLRLAPGRFKLRGFTGLFEDPDLDDPMRAAKASAFEVVDLVAGPNPRLTLTGESRSGLQVTPRVEGQGRPWLRIVGLKPGAGVDEAALAAATVGTNGFGITQSGPDDRVWTFMDLEPGAYVVGAWSVLDELYGYEVFQVDETIARVELVIRAKDDRRLSVSVVGPDGKGVPQPGRLRFSLERSRGGDEQLVRGLTTRSSDGTFGVWFPDALGEFFDPTDTSAQYTLLTAHPELGQVRTQLKPGELAVSVAFGAPTSILVRLQGYEEGDFFVRAVSLEQIKSGQASLDSNYGNLALFGDPSYPEKRLEGLSPGRYRVTFLALSPDAMLEESLLGWEIVDALEADVPVTFDVPVLHELRVLAPDLAEGQTVTLGIPDLDETLRWGRDPRSRSLDASRRCTFDVLPAGDYVLEAEGLEGPVRVTVPCGEVTLR
jgi:hypothetical protein